MQPPGLGDRPPVQRPRPSHLDLNPPVQRFPHGGWLRGPLGRRAFHGSWAVPFGHASAAIAPPGRFRCPLFGCCL